MRFLLYQEDEYWEDDKSNNRTENDVDEAIGMELDKEEDEAEKLLLQVIMILRCKLFQGSIYSVANDSRGR
jgi:hypothetical protein